VSAGVTELDYIRRGVQQQLRNDGRQRLDWRGFGVQSGVVPHACGSARVRLDRTEALVVVTAELGEPDAERPDAGSVECRAECGASVARELEGRGAQEANVALTRALELFFVEGRVIDVVDLCVVPGKQVWKLFIDALVVDSAGNLLDAVVIATKAALESATLPNVRVVKGRTPDEVEIEVPDDPFDVRPLKLAPVPLCVSLSRIGTHFVADASEDEEQCAAARLSVAVDRDGRVCGVLKGGAGGIALPGLSDAVATAVSVAAALHKSYDAALRGERAAADADARD
jgi:exosome complex component RRP42